MSDKLLEMVEHHGVLMVFATVLIGQIGVPIPAIAVLIGAGTLSAEGDLSVAGPFVAAMLACTIADCILFTTGRRYGMRVLNMIYRISFVSEARAADIQRRFERWGAGSLAIAKLIPGLSTLAPPFAGAMRMGWLRFVVLSGVGSVLWVGTGLGLGMALAEEIPRLLANLRLVLLAATGLIAIAAAYLGFRRWNRRRGSAWGLRKSHESWPH